MYARFMRYIYFPDKVAKVKPVAEMKGPMPEKVYCKDCQFLDKGSINSGGLNAAGEYRCLHESNRLSVPSDKSWYSPDEGWAYMQSPKQKNAVNNCIYWLKTYLSVGGSSHKP